MNTFMNELKKNAAVTLTENGDMTFSTTLNANLDFFGAAGALRNRPEAVRDLFEDALSEDRDLALMNLFYLRDIRGGLGERDAFREAYKVLARRDPDAAVKLIPAVGEYGRWDDIFCLLDLGSEALSNRVIASAAQQLVSDAEHMQRHEPVSLLAKWMPSINTSSVRTRTRAKQICRTLGITEKQYRQLLSSLRGYIDILERHLSAKDYSFDYAKLPSRALMKHVQAFIRSDNERYTAYRKALEEGAVKAKTKAVFPYEIIKLEDPNLRESMWRDIERHPGKTKTIVVRDGSGSMGWLGMGTYKNTVMPIDVATSLAILFSEQLTGDFKDRFITFSSRPQFVDLSNKRTLDEKLRKCRKYDECSNTDIMKVYRLILEAEKACDPADWIERIVIISDMQFDQGTQNVPSYEEAKALYEKAGIPLPKIVYWNVADRVAFPSSDLENVRFVSGLSQYTIQAVLNDTEADAAGFMKTTLRKYAPVLKLLSDRA